MGNIERQSLYGGVTSRIIDELEAGRLPWVQPWNASKCPCTMPYNAVIVHTVRHSDYIGSCLAVRRADEKAIFRAASQASKAADYLLSAGEHRS